MSDSCPSGAACDNPGRRPGNHATHTSTFSRNAADGRITHPRPNDAAPERCGARTMRGQNDAVPMDKWISRRIGLRPRNRLPTPANRIALPRAVAHAAGRLWVKGRREALRSECYPHSYPQKCFVVSGSGPTQAAAGGRRKRRKPASLLVMRGAVGGGRTAAVCQGRVANWPPSTPGIHHSSSI